MGDEHFFNSVLLHYHYFTQQHKQHNIIPTQSNMKIFKTLASAFLILASSAHAQDDYVRGQDPQADAIRDMQTGMAGLHQAANDPVMMAQLMEDMKNPEIMAGT